MVDLMSEKEITEIKEVFDLCSDSKDEISALNLQKSIKLILKVDLDIKSVRKIINEVDEEGNGTLDFPEFLSLISKKKKPVDFEKELNDTFNTFDESNNGLISAEQLFKILVKFGESVTLEEVKVLIKEFDHDNDKLINYEEFAKMMTS